jgi:hypothetical protein
VEFTWGERVREIRESVEENTTCLCPLPNSRGPACLAWRHVPSHPLVVPTVSLSSKPSGPHLLHQNNIVALSPHAPTLASSQSFELFLKLT